MRHAQAFRQHDYQRVKQLFLYQHPHPASLWLREKAYGSISHCQNRRAAVLVWVERTRLSMCIETLQKRLWKCMKAEHEYTHIWRWGELISECVWATRSHEASDSIRCLQYSETCSKWLSSWVLLPSSVTIPWGAKHGVCDISFHCLTIQWTTDHLWKLTSASNNCPDRSGVINSLFVTN